MSLLSFCLYHSTYLECLYSPDGLFFKFYLPFSSNSISSMKSYPSNSSEILFLLNSYSNVYLNNPFDNHSSTCKISLIAFFKNALLISLPHVCLFSSARLYTPQGQSLFLRVCHSLQNTSYGW